MVGHQLDLPYFANVGGAMQGRNIRIEVEVLEGGRTDVVVSSIYVQEECQSLWPLSRPIDTC